MKKIVFVTGASVEIGKATAIYLAKHGYSLYHGAWRIEKMQELRIYVIKTIALDVTGEESVIACIEQIYSEETGIDIGVNNARFGCSRVIHSTLSMRELLS